MLERVCKKLRIAVYAIGGVTPERAAKCLKAGASGVAVMSAILNSSNVRKTVKTLKRNLE
jgi:thiamine-phosphate pyrophosphorylase